MAHARREERKREREARKAQYGMLYDSLSENEVRECTGPARAPAGAGAGTGAGHCIGTGGEADSEEVVPCSVAAGLVDGWPVVAFVWAGELVTTAGDDLVAPEALGVALWLRRNANVGAFLPGCTYELRAVYGTGLRTVPYAFEGVVLAAAVQPNGHVLAPQLLPALAAALGLTCAVPYFVGPTEELKDRLPGLQSRTSPACPPQPAPPQPSLRYKGWLMEPVHSSSGKGTSSSRQDNTIGCVSLALSYSSVSYAAHMLHPLAVWDRLCFGGASRTGLADGLPPHLRTELSSQLDAWEGAWTAVRHEAAEALAAARDGGVLTQLAGLESQLATAVWAAEEQMDDSGAISIGRASAASERASIAGRGAGGAAGGAGGEAEGSHLGTGAVRGQDVFAAAGALLLQARASRMTDALPHPSAAPSASALFSRPAFMAAVAFAATLWINNGRGQPEAVLPLSPYLADVQFDVYVGGGSAVHVLRLLLLALRPSRDGSGLPGYAPSPAFEQLWASGWADGPQVGRMAAQRPAPMSQLLDELLEHCLAPLEGRDLVAALCVCRRWRRVRQRSGPGAAEAGSGVGAAGVAAGGGGRGDLGDQLTAGRRGAEKREQEWRRELEQERREMQAEQAEADAAAWEMAMEDDDYGCEGYGLMD
ncbi:hypothetical protein HYH03_007652 [Edaphochlamys debaryana]|uniref:F-box domain-containing protein n=1 Tax=Edaphochlamys debaryana TaxID=47281 RepID=A0A835YB47_9CHLO|nr:hypothetical protein HYH03_007652 [Edaphochlamys debaryana]|eukprot:KAG2494299.1 hypothetical protein HYH03_007652 [Edaphochlamys debaryana]